MCKMRINSVFSMYFNASWLLHVRSKENRLRSFYFRYVYTYKHTHHPFHGRFHSDAMHISQLRTSAHSLAWEKCALKVYHFLLRCYSRATNLWYFVLRYLHCVLCSHFSSSSRSVGRAASVCICWSEFLFHAFKRTKALMFNHRQVLFPRAHTNTHSLTHTITLTQFRHRENRESMHIEPFAFLPYH